MLVWIEKMLLHRTVEKLEKHSSLLIEQRQTSYFTGCYKLTEKLREKNRTNISFLVIQLHNSQKQYKKLESSTGWFDSFFSFFVPTDWEGDNSSFTYFGIQLQWIAKNWKTPEFRTSWFDPFLTCNYSLSLVILIRFCRFVSTVYKFLSDHLRVTIGVLQCKRKDERKIHVI